MKPTQEMLNAILDEAKGVLGQGKVANYIPALANVDPNKLGIAVCYLDGSVIQAGDAEEVFSIQSISKVLSLTLAMNLYSPEELWQRVGKEPSGHAFNSLIQLELENGIPRNPFINAGALVVSDLLCSRLSTPQYRLLELARSLSENDSIRYDMEVATSEMLFSDRNAAITYLMRSFGNIHNEVLPILTSYFKGCALSMSCVDLAKTFVYLANKGKNLGRSTQLILNAQPLK